MDENQAGVFDAAMLESTKRKAARIRVGSGVDDPWGSHLLGAPYARRGDEFPKAKSPLGWRLLAQVNYVHAAGMLADCFPKSGLLQLFVDPDSCMGMDFKEMNTNGFGHFCRFVSNPSVEDFDQGESDKLKYPKEGIPMGHEGPCVPLSAPSGLSFEPIEQLLLATDDPGKAEHFAVSEAILALGEDAEQAWYEMEEAPPPYSQLGGYAYFTQWDPRDPAEPWEVLLQLDTDPEFDLMWGDSGVGNVSIRRADLEKGDFSRLLFTWDCC